MIMAGDYLMFLAGATDLELLFSDPQIDEQLLLEIRALVEDTFINNMAENPITMRTELEPDVMLQPQVVTIPPLPEGVVFELKPHVINVLPKFEGKPSDDPILHLTAFHEFCMATKPRDVTEDQFKMRAFGFTLIGDARSWYFRMSTGSLDTRTVA